MVSADIYGSKNLIWKTTYEFSILGFPLIKKEESVLGYKFSFLKLLTYRVEYTDRAFGVEG